MMALADIRRAFRGTIRLGEPLGPLTAFGPTRMARVPG